MSEDYKEIGSHNAATFLLADGVSQGLTGVSTCPQGGPLKPFLEAVMQFGPIRSREVVIST